MSGAPDLCDADALDALGAIVDNREFWRGDAPNPARGTEPTPAKFKTISAFFKEYVPLDYAIDGLLRTSSLYTLTARTGHGKTAFLVASAFAVATGRRDILGIGAKRGRVAFLTFENPDDFRMRLMAAAYLYNINVNEADIEILDYRVKPEEAVKELKRLADVTPFTLVVVDTLAAFFDGNVSNDATQGGEFMRRMRPMTKVSGLPAVIVAAHPIKNADESNLLPFGTGAVINEADGGLTLWKNPSTGLLTFHWQGKLRGPDFEPIAFRLEGICCPDVIDAAGKQFEIPVLRTCDVESAEARENSDSNIKRALLKAMIAAPEGTQAEWANAIGRSKSTVNGHLQKLKREKFVKETLGKWSVTPQGKEAVQ